VGGPSTETFFGKKGGREKQTLREGRIGKSPSKKDHHPKKEREKKGEVPIPMGKERKKEKKKKNAGALPTE